MSSPTSTTTVPANPSAGYFSQGTSQQPQSLSGSVNSVGSEVIDFGDISYGGILAQYPQTRVQSGEADTETQQWQHDDPLSFLLHGKKTIADTLNYLETLPPSELGAVQAELYNAGYYSSTSSGGSPSSQISWGTLSTADSVAFTNFLQDAALATSQGTSLSMMIASRTAQYAQQQQSGSSRTPVNDLGQNYTITHLDPNQARDMVDQASLSVLGRTLPDDERAAMASWMDQNYTSKQMSAAQGKIEQARTNAVASANASDLVDPQTGKALDYNAAVALARQQLGVPYQWGGNGPQAGSAGFDCSGLVKYVYSQLGITLPRTSQEQWANGGGTKSTSLADAQPGDLVFFAGGDGTMSAPGHVGIYIGNGMMIDAPTTNSHVRVDNVPGFGGFVGIEHFEGATSQQNPPVTANSTSEGSTPQAQSGIASTQLAAFMAAERQQESGGDYQATNSIGASGAYQFTQPTWDEWAQKAGMSQWVGKPAASAPANVQDQVAATAMQSYYQQYGDWKDVASAWYSGKPLSQTDANVSQSGGPSIGDYVNSVISKMQTADPGALITTQGGRDVVTTPDTFTNTTMEDQTTEAADAQAELRARHPAEAKAHDTALAYDMLSKSLLTHINPTNG